MFKLTKSYPVEVLAQFDIDKRNLNSKQQKVRLKIEASLDEYHGMEQGDRGGFTANEKKTLAAIGTIIRGSDLTVEEKEAFTRQTKSAIEYKQVFGKGYPDQYFWRTIAKEKEAHTRATGIYNLLQSKTSEERQEILAVFAKLKYISTKDVKKYLAKMIKERPFEE
jgi:hypothetical protein